MVSIRESCTSSALGMGARYPAAAVRQGRYRGQPGGNRNAKKKSTPKGASVLIGDVGIFEFFVLNFVVVQLDGFAGFLHF